METGDHNNLRQQLFQVYIVARLQGRFLWAWKDGGVCQKSHKNGTVTGITPGGKRARERLLLVLDNIIILGQKSSLLRGFGGFTINGTTGCVKSHMKASKCQVLSHSLSGLLTIVWKGHYLVTVIGFSPIPSLTWRNSPVRQSALDSTSSVMQDYNNSMDIALC